MDIRFDQIAVGDLFSFWADQHGFSAAPEWFTCVKSNAWSATVIAINNNTTNSYVGVSLAIADSDMFDSNYVKRV